MTGNTSSNNHLKFVIAGLGCIGLIISIAIVGGVYYRLQNVKAPDMGNGSVNVPASAPIQSDIYTLSDGSEGRTRYEHHADCRDKIAGLMLQKMSFEFPSDMVVRSACADSNYVTLARLDDEGYIQQLFGFGFANIPLRIDDPVVEQLISIIQGSFAGVANARPMSGAPLSARGTNYISRRQFVKIHTVSGAYKEADYVNQVVLVPGPNDNGLSIIGMARVDSSLDETDAFQEKSITELVNSILFSE